MGKMKMESIDGVQSNIEKIAELFPNCITEILDTEKSTPNHPVYKKGINAQLLLQMLSDKTLIGDEPYDTSWVGRKNAILEANKPIRKTLLPVPEESINWDSTENLYIEGDNLEVLKLLQESYLGKIKMIYIDPPYNTGNDFVYPDTFITDNEEFGTGTGYFNEDGSINYNRTNSEAQGRFHSDWCSMIYSRLLLCRNLLRDDGAIFISIDDNEIGNLKKIAESVFGENNYIAIFPWKKRTAKSDVPFGVSQDYEWILAFAKSDSFKAGVLGKERKYYQSDDFPGRPWRIHDLTTQRTASERPNSNFTIVNPKNGDQFPANPNATWRVTRESIKQYMAEDRIVFPGDYPFLNIKKPVLRYWKEDDIKKAGDSFGKVAVSTQFPNTVGMSQDGTKEVQKIFGGKIFSYPKPTSLIKYLLQMQTGEDDIVLDFFSGSGTTADAVMSLNSEDGGNRKFILVQIPEPCSEKSEAFKAGYKNICEIGRERIKRVGNSLQRKQLDTEIDTGFRSFKLEDSNMKDIYYSPNSLTQKTLFDLESNIKEDRTDLDLFFGCILDWGLPLSLPYSTETIGGFKVHNYNNGDLIACFEDNVSEELVKEIASRQPMRAVFRDSSFGNSPEKINVFEIFKKYIPEDADDISKRVKVI